MDKQKLIEIVSELEKYIKEEDYKGNDPFDILNSPLFKLPVLNSSKVIRLLSQQVYRRIPFNIRPFLGIRKEINSVTLALCIQSYGYLMEVFPDKKEVYASEIIKLLKLLLEMSSKGYSGYSWGYNFDWEARYARINKFVPTIVATGIVTNSLFEYYKISNDKRIEDILISSADFIMNDLNKSVENNTICFSYSPNDHQKVYNATMKGARLLIQVYSITGNIQYLDLAEKTIKFVVNNQKEDGSWSYSKDDARTWVDNFHTAYILDSLDEYIILSGKKEYSHYLKKGLDYYIANLFTSEGYPKYYSTSFYPVDSTETAQSILTLLRFMKYDRAQIAAQFSLDYLYSGKGYFYYQKKNAYTIKTPYMRWSNAWMFLAFSKLLNYKYAEL